MEPRTQNPVILEFKTKVKVAQSCPTLQPHGLYSPWSSPGQNTGVGSCCLLQGVFPTQGLNPSLPHCRQILYQLSHQETLSSLKLVFIELTMPSNHLILCCPLLQLPSIFPSIRAFSNELAFRYHVAKVLVLQLQHQSFQ